MTVSTPDTDDSETEYEKKRIARELTPFAEDARGLAQALGLDPYPVNYWVVDHDEMNELIAYGGFQNRYPHWRWGMKYDRQKKKDQYFGGKAFEIVNNDNPAHAFLQMSNTVTDQKAVITHVEAHSDFFKNNQWFSTNPNATSMLARHSERIQSIMDDPDVSREDVERWIDHILCLEDNINQYISFDDLATQNQSVEDADDIRDRVDGLNLSDDVKREIFDEEWLDEQAETDGNDAPESTDILAFLRDHGNAYDEDSERAVEYEDWQREIIEMLREEAYYFAPQKMTKTMNEGWAAFWESMMMAEENFADDDEFITYADHQAAVLGSPGFNPYKLGKELWEYIENTSNRREVVDKLLRVDGITWQNFHNTVDFEEVHDLLSHPDSDDLAKRHYSLVKPHYRGFLKSTPKSVLKTEARYIFDDDLYETVEEALADVDYEVGWKRMREIRETHNDVTFIDAFLTDEFVKSEGYFAYEYNRKADQMQVSSTDAEDVKRKLLLKFTNFGKPTIKAADDNYRNNGELLLEHEYNGIMMDLGQAKKVLERLFHLWGRPVNLKTIVKAEKGGRVVERGRLLRYDGDKHQSEHLKWPDVEHLAADDIDYDTTPDEWL